MSTRSKTRALADDGILAAVSSMASPLGTSPGLVDRISVRRFFADPKAIILVRRTECGHSTMREMMHATGRGRGRNAVAVRAIASMYEQRVTANQ